MNRFSQKPLMLLFLCVVSLSACKKDSDDEKSNTEKLTVSAWKYEKAEVDLDKDGDGDTPIPDSEIEACERDNIIVFKADGTGTIDEGPSKCNTSDPQSMGFTWTFKDGEKIINFPTAIVAGVDGDVTVKSITETNMVLAKTIIYPGVPLPVNVILTLKH
jgi:hypothetical protein